MYENIPALLDLHTMPIWPWVIPLLKGIGSSVAGGIISGAGRRTERAVAGRDAAQDYGGGATAQFRSQGQSESFQAAQAQQRSSDISTQGANQQYNQLQHDSRERALQRQHERSQLAMELGARNGDPGAGQIPGVSPFMSPAQSQQRLDNIGNEWQSFKNATSGPPIR